MYVGYPSTSSAPLPIPSSALRPQNGQPNGSLELTWLFMSLASVTASAPGRTTRTHLSPCRTSAPRPRPAAGQTHMMPARTFILRDAAIRQRAADAVLSCPVSAEQPLQVVIGQYKRKRSLAQNALMWLWIDAIRLHILDSTGDRPRRGRTTPHPPHAGGLRHRAE